MSIRSVAEKLFFQNRVTFNICKDIYYEKTFLGKITRGIQLIKLIPSIKKLNQRTRLEIEQIHKNGHVFEIQGGGTRTKFYLPQLDLKGGQFIPNRIFYEHNYFEIDTLEKVAKYIPREAVCLDIGANIGNHTLYFVKEAGAKKVYSFEPVTDTFQILKKNMELNHLENQVVCYNAGCGEKASKGTIDHYDKNDAGSTSLKVTDTGNIDIIRIDDIELDDKVDFIKIDVEGFEQQVIKGATTLITRDKPVMYIEIHEGNYGIVNKHLELLGYMMVEQLSMMDYIFLADS